MPNLSTISIQINIETWTFVTRIGHLTAAHTKDVVQSSLEPPRPSANIRGSRRRSELSAFPILSKLAGLVFFPVGRTLSGGCFDWSWCQGWRLSGRESPNNFGLHAHYRMALEVKSASKTGVYKMFSHDLARSELMTESCHKSRLLYLSHHRDTLIHTMALYRQILLLLLVSCFATAEPCTSPGKRRAW